MLQIADPEAETTRLRTYDAGVIYIIIGSPDENVNVKIINPYN